MENLFLESMIEKIIHSLQTLEGTVVEKDKSYDVSMRDWAWPQGVALFAMYQYYATKRDPALLKYLEDWFAEHFEAGLPPVDVNNTCPMLTLTYLYEETGNPEYKKHLDKWCDEIIAHFPRTEEGGFTHYIVTLPNEGQLWDDTLYMTVLFLARMGQLRKEPALQQESIRQFLVHIKYLTDTRTGLLFHGWDFNGRHNFAQARWARGNSWYTAGLVDYLSMTQLESGVEAYLFSTLEQQVKALEQYQADNGLWHTIIDRPDTHLETSASSAFAYGILKAVREGKLSAVYERVGLKAAQGVLDMIAPDGTVQGVSAGTPVFRTVEEYNEVEVRPMPYGQSMALLMLAELIKH